MDVLKPIDFYVLPDKNRAAGGYVTTNKMDSVSYGWPRTSAYTTRPESFLSFNPEYYYSSGILNALDSKNRGETITIGHEIAHDYQNAARMRDYFQKALDRGEVNPSYVFDDSKVPPGTYARDNEFLKKEIPYRVVNKIYPDAEYFRRAFKDIPSERLSGSYRKNRNQYIDGLMKMGNYYIDPQEVNARGVGSAFAAKKEIEDFIKHIDDYARYSGFQSFNAMPEHEKINLKNTLRSHALGLNFSTDANFYSKKMLANIPLAQQYLSSSERSNQRRLASKALDDVRRDIARGIYMGEVEAQSQRPLSPEETERINRQKLIKQKVAEIKGKSALKDVAGKVATTLLDPTQPVIDATVAQAAKVAPKFTNIDILPASRSRITNAPKPVASGLAYTGAGIAGGIVGEYLVKPAAEKAGVFNAVEKGSRAVYSTMPNWAVDVADKSLGTAQFALDPITPIANIMQKGMEASTQREVDSIIDVGRPSQVRFRGPKF